MVKERLKLEVELEPHEVEDLRRLADRVGLKIDDVVGAAVRAMAYRGLLIVNTLIPECHSLRRKDKRVLKLSTAIMEAIDIGVHFYSQLIKPLMEKFECLGYYSLEDLWIDESGTITYHFVAYDQCPFLITDFSLAITELRGAGSLLASCHIENVSEEKLNRLEERLSDIADELDVCNVWLETLDEEFATLNIYTEDDDYEYLPSIKELSDSLRDVLMRLGLL